MPLTPRQINENEWTGWKADDTIFFGERRFLVLAKRILALRPRRMLNIGCGSGFLEKLIQMQSGEVETHGIDFSLHALARCKHLNQSYCVNLEQSYLPFNDGSFDLIVCSEVLEHLFHPIHVMTEIHRVLHDNGTVILTVPNFSFWRFRLQSLAGKVPNAISHPGHFQVFNKSLLSSMIRNCHFRIISISGIHQRIHFVEHISPGLTCDTLVSEIKKDMLR